MDSATNNVDPAARLYQELQKAKGIPDLAAAYVAAWGKMSNVQKDANNPHFGSDYATLEAVLNLIRPIFASEGLAVFQGPGKMVGDKVVVSTMLLHKSGQSLSIETDAPIGGKSTAQAMGAVVTYIRRYALMAIAGIAPTDDDGNEASTPAPARKPKAESKLKAEEASGDASYADQVVDIKARIDAVTTNEERLGLKDEVIAFNDQDVADYYTAKGTALREAAAKTKKGAKS